jgi:hypothetical protein
MKGLYKRCSKRQSFKKDGYILVYARKLSQGVGRVAPRFSKYLQEQIITMCQVIHTYEWL